MIHSFLLIGQSNMAGRGVADESVPPFGNDKNIRVLINGRWQKAWRPLNPDREKAGVCLAESFAADYRLDHPDVQVGLIPCADGGTGLDQWQPGEILFENAVHQLRFAMKSSVVAGILWHQGEHECGDGKIATYAPRLENILGALQKEIGGQRVPVVIGALGDYLKDYEPTEKFSRYGLVNEQLRRVASGENRAFVPADGLVDKGDHLHFSGPSLIEFGHRYYRAYQTLKNPALTADLPAEQKELSAMELL